MLDMSEPSAGGGFGGFGGGGGGVAKAKVAASSGSSLNTASRDAEGNVDGSITVKAWDPDTPYLNAIRDAYKVYKTTDAFYAEYINQREKYRHSPAFYLDCASLFFKEKQPKLALRIISNLSELKIDDVSLLRVYAWRLREAGDYDNAIVVLRKVAKLRPDEAISWRDLALTLTMRGKEKKNANDIQEALELFHKTAFTPWTVEGKRGDARWTAIIALEEFNELAAWSKRQSWSKAPKIPNIDDAFNKNLEMDMRIMMTWDADSTDIDMHVIEPSHEEVFYKNQLSATGGLLSHDVTNGYGPEEFLHKLAPKGKYVVQTKYFASHQQRLVGPATITVTFYTNWGRKNQTSKTMTLRLDKEKDKVTVGEYELK